jgi:hypothetical protein
MGWVTGWGWEMDWGWGLVMGWAMDWGWVMGLEQSAPQWVPPLALAPHPYCKLQD